MRYGVEQPRSQGSLLPALADRQEPWERGWGWKLYVFSFLHIKLFSPAVFLWARICFRDNIFGPSCHVTHLWLSLPSHAHWTSRQNSKTSKSYSVPCGHFSSSEIGAAQLAASRSYRNRAKITVLMCEQKPYPVWFPRRRKSYAVKDNRQQSWVRV